MTLEDFDYVYVVGGRWNTIDCSKCQKDFADNEDKAVGVIVCSSTKDSSSNWPNNEPRKPARLKSIFSMPNSVVALLQPQRNSGFQQEVAHNTHDGQL